MGGWVEGPCFRNFVVIRPSFGDPAVLYDRDFVLKFPFGVKVTILHSCSGLGDRGTG